MLPADQHLFAAISEDENKQINVKIKFMSDGEACSPIKDLEGSDTLQTLEDRIKDRLDAGVTHFTINDDQGNKVDKAKQLEEYTEKVLTLQADDDAFGSCRKILAAMKDQVFLPKTERHQPGWKLAAAPKAWLSDLSDYLSDNLFGMAASATDQNFIDFMEVFRHLATNAEAEGQHFIGMMMYPEYSTFTTTFKHELYWHWLQLARGVAEPVPQRPCTIALTVKNKMGAVSGFVFFAQKGMFPETFSRRLRDNLQHDGGMTSPLQNEDATDKEDTSDAAKYLIRAMASLDCYPLTSPMAAEVLEKADDISKIKLPAWDPLPSKWEIIRMAHVQLRLSSGVVPVVKGSLSLPLLEFSSDLLRLHLMVLRYCTEGVLACDTTAETPSARGDLECHLDEAKKFVNVENRGVLIVVLDLPSDVSGIRQELNHTKTQGIRVILCTKDLA